MTQLDQEVLDLSNNAYRTHPDFAGWLQSRIFPSTLEAGTLSQEEAGNLTDAIISHWITRIEKENAPGELEVREIAYEMCKWSYDKDPIPTISVAGRIVPNKMPTKPIHSLVVAVTEGESLDFPYHYFPGQEEKIASFVVGDRQFDVYITSPIFYKEGTPEESLSSVDKIIMYKA